MIKFRSKNKKFAIQNKHGKLITPYVFDSVEPFFWGYAIARIKCFGDYIYSSDGKVAFKQCFDNVCRYGVLESGEEDPERDSVYYSIRHKGKSCILDWNLKTLAPWGAYRIHSGPSEGIWVIQDRMLRYGFAGNGRFITPCLYHNYRSFHNGFAMVKWRNEKWGMIDSAGNLVIPDIYDSIEYMCSEGLVGACKDGKYGYLDTYGRTVIPFIFSRIDIFRKGVANVTTLDGRHREIDRTGHFIDDLGPCTIPEEVHSKYVTPSDARVIADKRRKIRKWFNTLEGKEFITTKKTRIEYLVHYAAPYTGAGEDCVKKGMVFKLRQKMRDDAWYCSLVNGDDTARIYENEKSVAGRKNPRLAGRCTGISFFLTEEQLSGKSFIIHRAPKKKQSTQGRPTKEQ